MNLDMFVGTRITDLTAMGLEVRNPYGFAYDGVWTYITPTGVVLTTDGDGVILSVDAPTDN